MSRKIKGDKPMNISSTQELKKQFYNAIKNSNKSEVKVNNAELYKKMVKQSELSKKLKENGK